MTMDQMAEKLRTGYPFVLLSWKTRLISYIQAKRVRKIRNHLLAARLAFPDSKMTDIDFIDRELLDQAADILKPYYRVRKDWKAGDDRWTFFIKVAEPPKED